MQTALEKVAIIDGALGISDEKQFASDTSELEFDQSKSSQKLKEIATDDSNNDYSFVIKVMNPNELSRKTDDENCIRRAIATQENGSVSSLPPISQSQIPVRTLSCNFTKMNPEVIKKLLKAPRNRKIPRSPSHPRYDESPYVVLADESNYADEFMGEKRDSLHLKRLQTVNGDILHNNQHLVNINSETSWNDLLSGDSNDNDISWCTTSLLSEDENASISEQIEVKRNESSFEELSSNDSDSSKFHKMDILEEADLKSFTIPRFYYPCGIPIHGKEICNKLEAVKKIFCKYNDQIDLLHMKEVCLLSGLCPLWKKPLYNCFSKSTSNFINLSDFAIWWKKFEENAHDEPSRFVYIMTNGKRDYLIADDFEALIQDLIDTLPSLDLLKEATVFHQAYIKTVIVRIFWNVCRSWKKHISIAELRLSNLLKAIAMLERKGINEEREFFSYEHFYVIYCNFCLLDKNEKNYLTPFDLSLYSNGALTDLVIHRIFSGAVLPNNSAKQAIDYSTFINFLLAEVDKCHPKSIEYWFRIMDLNGDGFITFDEMEQFYNEIMTNVIRMNVNVITFDNLINMLKDMISSNSSTYFTLSDLKRSPALARYFFNTFINWIKHIAQESCLIHTENEMDSQQNDWNCFCKSEYKILTADLIESEGEIAVDKFGRLKNS